MDMELNAHRIDDSGDAEAGKENVERSYFEFCLRQQIATFLST